MRNKSRTALLGITAIAIAFTLGKSVISPRLQSPQIADYTFPESIALSEWELLLSKPVNPDGIPNAASISGKFIAGKHYRYRQNEKYLDLDIEMRYLVNTDGDVKIFILSHTGELSPGLRQDGKGGFYSLYSHEGKAYLHACINPRGGSTITSDHFKRNRMLNDTPIERILPWLLGQAELHDKRCLWAILSIPLDLDSSVEETYRTLETVWFDWHDWWRANFPRGA